MKSYKSYKFSDSEYNGTTITNMIEHYWSNISNQTYEMASFLNSSNAFSGTYYKHDNNNGFIIFSGQSPSYKTQKGIIMNGNWTWTSLVTNTDLGIVYHPNINIPSTKTAIENYIKTNLGTLRRFNTVRSDPAAGSESGILPGGTSFCILWQCSSVAYGWVTLYSDLIGRPIVYGIINGTFTWYTPNLTQI